MIIYNVTVSIDQAVEQDWLNWMRVQHIPAVLQTGCFLESRLSRVNGEEDGGCTYSVMYLAPDQEALDHYQTEFAPALQQDHAARYQGRFAAFRTTLQLIEEYKR
ncbi:MAG: DUF4286 family protein [Cryomorphaceae bacterium]|jgi:hypothetical protein|nr:DUF4286 family protein [Cryomorphaceae bacterium]